MGLEVLPQAAAIVVAAGGALSDALRGKIYNKWLLVGVVVAFLWLLSLPLLNHLGADLEYRQYPELGLWTKPKETKSSEIAPWEKPENFSVWPPVATAAQQDQDGEPSYIVYLARVFANAGIALLAGFALWWYGLWAAGDAKMFATLSLLLPLSTYKNAFMPVFPSYVLLFNTFASLMVILATELIVRIVRQALRPAQHEAMAVAETAKWLRQHWRELLLGFIGLIFVFVALKVLRGLFRDFFVDLTHLETRPVVYLVLVLAFHPLAMLLRKKWALAAVAALSAAYIVYVAIWPSERHNIASVMSVSALALSVMLFYLLYGLYLNVFDFKAIRLWELKPRMILARRTIEVLKEDLDMLEKKMGPVGPDGLSKEQVEVLRRWWIDRGKGGTIWVSRTFPFAPALFIGTILTVVLADYVFWT